MNTFHDGSIHCISERQKSNPLVIDNSYKCNIFHIKYPATLCCYLPGHIYMMIEGVNWYQDRGIIILWIPKNFNIKVLPDEQYDSSTNPVERSVVVKPPTDGRRRPALPHYCGCQAQLLSQVSVFQTMPTRKLMEYTNLLYKSEALICLR